MMPDKRIRLTPEEAKRVITCLCVDLAGSYYAMFPEDILDKAVREIDSDNHQFYDRFSDLIEISD